MRLYSGTPPVSLRTRLQRINWDSKTERLVLSRIRFQPLQRGEFVAQPLRAMAQVSKGTLLNHGVILDFSPPHISPPRLLITGRNNWSRENSVVIDSKSGTIQDGGGRNELATWLGAAFADVLTRLLRSDQYKTVLRTPTPH